MKGIGTPSYREVINNIISKKLQEKYRINTDVSGDTKFEDVGFDSLDVMEAIIEVEGATKKHVEDNKIKNIIFVKDIYKLFEEEYSSKN